VKTRTTTNKRNNKMVIIIHYSPIGFYTVTDSTYKRIISIPRRRDAFSKVFESLLSPSCSPVFSRFWFFEISQVTWLEKMKRRRKRRRKEFKNFQQHDDKKEEEEEEEETDEHSFRCFVATGTFAFWFG